MEKYCQEIVENMRSFDFERNENIKDNLYRILFSIMQLMNKKNSKNIIEPVLPIVFKDTKS